MFALKARSGARPLHAQIVAATCGVILAASALGAAAQDAKPAAPATPAAAPSPSDSSGAAKPSHSGMQPNLDKLFADLDLTPDQKKHVQQIMVSTIGRLSSLKDQVGNPKNDLHDLLVAPTVDRAAFEAWRAKEMATVDQASRIVADAFVEVAQTLTPEQRAKLAEKIQGKKADTHASTQTPATAPIPTH